MRKRNPKTQSKGSASSAKTRSMLFVLGMHRSGTSTLSGFLTNLGFEIGKSVMPPGEDNPRGFYENARIVALHDDALAQNGVSWNRPAAGALISSASPEFTDKLVDILETDFDSRRPWMIKDPRLAFTFSLWKPVLKAKGIEPIFINMLRNPDHVVRSLFLRNGINPNWGYHLYLAYVNRNQKLLARVPADNKHTLSFEALLKAPDSVRRQVSAHLDQKFDLPEQPATEPGSNISKRLANNNMADRRYSQAGLKYQSTITAALPEADYSSFLKYCANENNADDFLLSGKAFFEELSIHEEIKYLRQKANAATLPPQDIKPKQTEPITKQKKSEDETRFEQEIARLEIASLLRQWLEATEIENMNDQEKSLNIDQNILQELRSGDLNDLTPVLGLLQDAMVKVQSNKDIRLEAKELRSKNDGLIADVVDLRKQNEELRSRGDQLKDGLVRMFYDFRVNQDEALGRTALRALGVTDAYIEHIHNETLDTNLLDLRPLLASIAFRASTLMAHEGEIEIQRAEIEKLSEQHAALVDSNETLQETLQRAEIAREKYARESDNAIAKLEKEKSALEARHNKAVEKLTISHLKAVEIVKTKSAENAKKAAASLEALKADYSARIESQKSEHLEKIAALQAELATRTSEKQAIISSNEADIRSLSSELERHVRELEVLNAHQGDLLAAQNTLQQEKNAETARADLLGREKAELTAELAEARKQIEGLTPYPVWLRERDEEIEGLRRQVALLKKTYDAEVGGLKQTVGILQQSVDVYAKRPIREATKLMMFGVARTSYRLMPLPRVMKEAMASSFRRSIGGKIFPANSLELPNHSKVIKLIPELVGEELATMAKGLSFPEHDQPDVSIIVPVYNQISYTLACLKSLQEHRSHWTFEVIVMDDVSSDETEEVLRDIPSLRYVRNAENLGFVKNCNAGANLARGEYLVFLNNDTLVHDGWLSYLRQTFNEHDKVGVVGSKLIYGDGRLQEVGGIVWDDASGWNVGRLADPNDPNFSYLRDVDYVSGASLMILKDLFFEMGQFDLAYVPAYYEDTSLCFEVRAAGYRVMCQPLSVITHFEGITSGTDLGSGVKKHQVINQATFRQKWAHVLEHHLPNAVTPHLARDSHPKGHVLIVDATTPTPEEDSGSIDMVNLIQMLMGQGYRVHFVPQDNMAQMGHHTAYLQRLGVLCVYAPFYTSLDDYLDKTEFDFDLVILSRVNVARQEIDVLDKWIPQVPRIFYTVDLHHLRERRAAEESGDIQALRRAEETREQELSIMGRCDTTIILSEAENKMLLNQGVSGLEILPLLRDFDMLEIKPFDQREGIGFVGGFRHAPNIEAVHYLLDEIWPLVQRGRADLMMPPIPLLIGGSHMPNDLAAKIDATKGVTNVGFIHDLKGYFSGLRYTIAPLKTGAGLKGKVAESWGNGVPVLGTQIAFEGLPEDDNLEKLLLQADNPSAMSALILECYDDRKGWAVFSEKAQIYACKAFGLASLQSSIEGIIHRTITRAENRR